MITDQQIETAQQAAEQAAVALAAVEGTPSTSAEQLAGAILAQRRTASQLASLLTQRQAQELTAVEHAQAEQQATVDLDAATAELDASRTAVQKAVKQAERALRMLLDAGEAHDALVRSVASTLTSRGLPLVDRHGIEYATGGERTGAVRIRGRWWLPVSAPAVFMRTAHGVAGAVYGQRHDLTRRLNRFVGTDRLDSRPDGLLDGCPLPVPAQFSGLVVVRAEESMIPPSEAPYLIKAANRAAARAGL